MSYLLKYPEWKRLFEQATQSNTEALVLAWWNKHKDKKSSAAKSLQWWSGASTQPKVSPSSKQDNVVANLKKIVNTPTPNGANGTNAAAALTKIIVALENLSKNGVYIQDFSDKNRVGKFGPGAFLDSLSARPDSGLKVWTNSGLADQRKAMLTNVDLIVKNINNPSLGGKSAFTPLTDETKAQLIAQIEDRAQRRVKALTNQRKKGYTLEDAIKEAISIWIVPDKEAGSIQTEEAKTAATEGDPITYNYSYPSKENPFDTTMQNFFGDNEYQVSEKDKQVYSNMVKESLDSIIEAGGTITAIAYSAGASTSKVNTNYIGKGKTGDKWNSENNKILVKDRLASINAVLEELLQPYASSANIELTKQNDESAPNLGPGWNEYSTEGGKYKYGPLYEAARKTNSSLTPKEFYAPSKRKSDSSINEEYNSVFGKFRGNYGEFSVVAKFTDKPIEPGKEELIGAGAWKAKIAWKVKPKKAPSPKKINRGGGKSYVGVNLNKTACFIN